VRIKKSLAYSNTTSDQRNVVALLGRRGRADMIKGGYPESTELMFSLSFKRLFVSLVRRSSPSPHTSSNKVLPL